MQEKMSITIKVTALQQLPEGQFLPSIVTLVKHNYFAQLHNV